MKTVFLLFKPFWGAARPCFKQSHYREVLRWGVSNGARHNWKCFLASIFFLNFLRKKYLLTLFYAKNVFIVYNVFFLKRKKIAHETGPNPAQISIPVPERSPTARLLCNDFGFKSENWHFPFTETKGSPHFSPFVT